jgi:hypothetical protein
MFNPLVNRKDAAITCARQPAMIQQRLQGAQHLVISVAVDPYFINMIGRRKMQAGFVNGFTTVI